MPIVSHAPADFDDDAQRIDIALQADALVNSGSNLASMMVPFGTEVLDLNNEFMGVCESGSLKYASDVKERADGNGGIRGLTHHKHRIEGTVEITFHLSCVRPKNGDLFRLRGPARGNASAPGGTSGATRHGFEELVFSVVDLDYKFGDSDYAKYTVNVIHHRGLHNSADLLSAQVDKLGAVVEWHEAPVNGDMSGD